MMLKYRAKADAVRARRLARIGHGASDPGVAGSNPAGPANLSRSTDLRWAEFLRGPLKLLSESSKMQSREFGPCGRREYRP